MVTGILNPSTWEAETENCHAFEADPGCVVNCRPVKPCCKNFKEKKQTNKQSLPWNVGASKNEVRARNGADSQTIVTWSTGFRPMLSLIVCHTATYALEGSSFLLFFSGRILLHN